MTQFVSGSVLTASSLNTAFNTQTIATATTNYTVGSANAGELVLLNSASAGTVTIPLDATYSFPVGSIIEMYNSGAGSWSIATAGTASTVSGSSTTLSQYQASRLIKTAPSTWFVDGGAIVKNAGLDLVTPTSIANSGGSASLSGGAVTFSAVTSLSLNGAFTSTYDTYMLTFDTTFSANNNVAARLRASGTDNSGATSYVDQYLYAAGATTGAARTTTSSWIDFTSANTGSRNNCVSYLFGPALARITSFQSLNQYATSGASLQWIGGTHDQAVSYDGITFIPSSGNMTGTLRVYGMKN